MTNPSEPQSLGSRVTKNEEAIREQQVSTSDLKSTVATLAELVFIQQEEAQAMRLEAQADRERAAADRAQIQERMNRFEAQAEADRAQASADRALMLQLIQAIAQGRNGGQ